MKDLLLVALSQYGVKEVPGKQHNEVIINYAKEIGLDWVDEDETPWCAIFMNWCAKRSGYERTGTALARDWLKVGEETNFPEMGDIVVFSRGNSPWQGHVGLYVNTDADGFIHVLGGNQSNQVTITKYRKRNLLGYRKLKKV